MEGSSSASREYSVSQITRDIKLLLESQRDFQDIWVKGEASNVRLPGSGHLYFTLKDRESQITCAWFGFGRGRKKPPADGDAISVHGNVRVYPRGGNYQIIVDDFIRSGVG